MTTNTLYKIVNKIKLGNDRDRGTSKAKPNMRSQNPNLAQYQFQKVFNNLTEHE